MKKIITTFVIVAIAFIVVPIGIVAAEYGHSYQSRGYLAVHGNGVVRNAGPVLPGPGPAVVPVPVQVVPTPTPVVHSTLPCSAN